MGGVQIGRGARSCRPHGGSRADRADAGGRHVAAPCRAATRCRGDRRRQGIAALAAPSLRVSAAGLRDLCLGRRGSGRRSLPRTPLSLRSMDRPSLLRAAVFDAARVRRGRCGAARRIAASSDARKCTLSVTAHTGMSNRIARNCTLRAYAQHVRRGTRRRRLRSVQTAAGCSGGRRARERAAGRLHRARPSGSTGRCSGPV